MRLRGGGGPPPPSHMVEVANEDGEDDTHAEGDDPICRTNEITEIQNFLKNPPI